MTTLHSGPQMGDFPAPQVKFVEDKIIGSTTSHCDTNVYPLGIPNVSWTASRLGMDLITADIQSHSSHQSASCFDFGK